MNLIRYNGPKHQYLFSLMIGCPEKPADQKNVTSDYAAAMQNYLHELKQCEESAIGIDNPEVLPNVRYIVGCPWLIDELCKGLAENKLLHHNDTFPLPDSIEYEIVNKQNGVAVFDGERKSINNDVVVRLKLKSVPEKDTVIRNFKDDLQYGVQRILRDQGAASREVFVAINDTVEELISKYTITRNP